MIDGFTLKFIIQNFAIWRRSLPIQFSTNVETETGAIKTKTRGPLTITTHFAKWETYNLTVKEVLNSYTGQQNCYLTIEGSLHKNQFGGTNHLPFTFQQLQEQIDHVCKTLFIDPTKAQISTLEVGVNIRLPFAVTPFLRRNVISYKGNSFNRYNQDKNGICLGIYCNLSQYAVKLYDKGLQYQLQENLLRYELRFLKMQTLNSRGIKFLSDLRDYQKVNGLLSLLLDNWENVLIYDITTLQNLTLKKGEKELLTTGQNPKFWERLKETTSGDHFKYQRSKFKNLVEKHGLLLGRKIMELIIAEWQNLFKNYPILPSGENEVLPDLTIKIKGKNGETDFIGPQIDPTKSYIEKRDQSGQPDTKKRNCLSCGRDISHQTQNSKFCSSRYVGYEAAHKCRNQNSNPRNNLKRKIETINQKGVLFDVVPYLRSSN